MFNNFCFLFTQYVTKIQQVINITFFFIAALNKRQVFFFYQGFLSRILTTHRTAGEGRGPSYSILQLPPAHEHPDIYLQLCT